MSLYIEFKKAKSDLFFKKDLYQKIFRIFEGKGGDQIITDQILPKGTHIQDLLILNSDMKRARDSILMKIQELVKNDIKFSENLFYFSQYGGSKTQFLNLVKSIIWQHSPNCIPILLEDISQIKVRAIFEKMIGQLLKRISIIPKFEENTQLYDEFLSELNKLISRVHIAFNQSKNLGDAHEIINKLMNIKNPVAKDQLRKLNDILHSTIMVDKIDILNEIVLLMKFCSKYDLIFLFMFDEMDLWLKSTSDHPELSQKFRDQHKFMKKILDIPKSQVKIFFLFACTDRVNRLLFSQDQLFINSSPAASRLNQIYVSAEKIMEAGCYGSEIKQALVKIAIYYLANNEKKDFSEQFFTQVAPILEKKYQSYSRRTSNSRIIRMLESYQFLVNPLTYGMKHWENNVKLYGDLIEEHLDKILKRIHIKFVRKEILVDPSKIYSKDRLDGYFVIYGADRHEVKTYVEIKLTKKFEGKKASQFLQWLSLNLEKKIVLIVFSPTPKSEILKQISLYADSQGYPQDFIKRIELIHIENPYAFAPINYLSDKSLDSDQILNFYNLFAFWLDFIGDFSHKFQQVIDNIGFGVFPPETHIGGNSEASGIEDDGPPPDDFTLEEKISLNLMLNLYLEKAFTPSGKMGKAKIEKIISQKALGISDLEKSLENMREGNLLLRITDKQVQFDKDLIHINDLDNFKKKIRSVLTNSKNTQGINSFF
ncbi:hypothetical protein DSAG12_02128 [Promethearchaeum syntrophicum]|uniref:Uncharacterized protein n=1 Tax=Promethearchaeum syntrophicum TaxID=2594042 RepID=A0A5B9DAX9_9ARCH|nr:hypothetical protein [Candidatus Prometheoarchaeum syntrophicum]QEE16298.1 hypothetical protein DSAG12_02128 [Candidatus Prometheoarchaeum syntrophicum]